MTIEDAIESYKYSNEQAKKRLEAEKIWMDIDEIKELEFYIERDEMAIQALLQGSNDRLIECPWCGTVIQHKVNNKGGAI